MIKESKKWLIVANWKMNPVHSKLAKQIFSSVKKTANTLKNTETVVCPPFVYLENLKSSGHRYVLGSQDIFWQPEGAFTGNISYLQLKNLGLKYSIVGHSERRTLGENDKEINLKMKASLLGSIVPILCIGEKDRDDKGEYLKYIKNQIEQALNGLPKASMKDVVIAYEPLWAIGKSAKREANSREIFEMVIYIKKVLSDIYDTKSVPSTKIIYGGSVDDKNIEVLLKDSGVDGFLVGRISLDPKKFSELLKKVDKNKK